jgi:hypothetical protein
MTCNLEPTLSVRRSLLLCLGTHHVWLTFLRWRSIGHWLFTTLLLPALFAATEVSPTREKARVVNVSSSASYLTAELDFDAFEDGPQRRKYGIWELYNKSKFVSVLDT